MRSFYQLLLIAVIIPLIGIGFIACDSDNISDDSYFTFVGNTVKTYCETNEELSTFYQLIKDTDNESLLATYGHYTCFIPTNEAFNSYFQEKETVYEQLTLAEKKEIVYNHLIRSVVLEYYTKDFSEGALSTTNMNNRYLVISYKNNESGKLEILVNKNAPIIAQDIEVHNGVIHIVGEVVSPSNEGLGKVLEDNPQFSLFAEAFALTHWGDSITEMYDSTFVSPFSTELVDVLGWNFKVPAQRRLGYTIFAETNDVFKAKGIHNLQDLIEYAKTYYGTSHLEDYTSTENPLNKFIAYHLLNRQMSTNSFLYTGACTAPSSENDRTEFYETMLQYRLMEIKAGNQINTQRNGQYIALNEQESNLSGLNGFVHTLQNILVYDTEIMEGDVLNKRIRFDAYSIPPQLTNNNIRWQLLNGDGFAGYTVSPDFCEDYLRFNDASKIIFWASESWTNYQADEMSIRGWYDFTIRMHPVPPGTYEIRLGYRAEPWRGIAQLFIDDEIVGIPVNLSYTGNEPTIGWVSDDDTTDGGIENDKMMRNRGYMKAPASIYSLNGPKTLRQDINSLRIVIGTFTFQDYAPHYFRAKNVESENGEFHLDYLEYIPTNLIENEDKY